MIIAAAHGGTSAASVTFGIIVTVLAILAYWLPTLVAWRRRVPNVGQIALLNFLLGWTVIGWIVALIWAAKPVPAEAAR